MEVEGNCNGSHGLHLRSQPIGSLQQDAMIGASPHALARVNAWGGRRHGYLPFQRTIAINFPRISVRTYATSDQEAHPPTITEGEQEIMNKLRTKFNPSRLLVQDVSGMPSTEAKLPLADKGWYRRMWNVLRH